ncbi:fatty acid desaturase CarF family protein [Nocardia mexicana]|uniref:Ubiquitin-conjugating enzyme E2 variant n=1 Tax=Nocardia mexicana TaxID=279262 RepID=A0A370HEW6_9NOCA|nr:fatty acid desaturase CarF family protein [Nocardia mexicana]RDI55582.1 ubiquitin-conjugating enzyme E2 variant [Nocardia mexicana]
MTESREKTAVPDTIPAGPKWTGPDDPAPGSEYFAQPSYSRREIATHVAGAVLNAGACVAVAVELVRAGGTPSSRIPSAVAGLLAGGYAADLASGVLHWAFDTWFDENTPGVRRVVLIVREHHIYPQRIFNHGLAQDVGIMSWFGLAGVAPSLLTARSRGMVADLTRVAGLSFSVLLTLSLEFHKIGHRTESPRAIAALQHAGILLSVKHHMKHHAREHDSHYCLVNGVGDRTLGRLGLFRLLERAVRASSGIDPRTDDRLWRRRFGRWVSGS